MSFETVDTGVMQYLLFDYSDMYEVVHHSYYGVTTVLFVMDFNRCCEFYRRECREDENSYLFLDMRPMECENV